MRRALPVVVAAVAALCVGQLPAADLSTASAVSTSAVAKAAKKKVRTPFALTAVAFGTKVTGGQVPANSDSTAYQRISCTNVSGINRRNYEADLMIPGLGKAEGVTTRVWTTKNGRTVSSNSEHSIAKVTIVDTPLGSLELRGLSSRSSAFNKAGKFGTSTDTSVARLVLKPTGLPPQDLRLPTPNRPVVVPGIAKVEIGKSSRQATSKGAVAAANVLDVTVLPTGSRVRVADTRATIGGGIKSGVFAGFGAGVQAKAVDDNLRVGRTPLQPMPCEGTSGKRLAKSVARVNLADQIVLDGVGAAARAVNRKNRATGMESGFVAKVELAEGRLKINAIRGVVNVSRTKGGGLSRNTKGTSVGSIVFDGETYSLPSTGPLEIPGIAKIEDAVTTRFANGIRVVGLQITLLDGTGAVVDLGVAQLLVRRGASR